MSGICGLLQLDGAPADPAQLQEIANGAPHRGNHGIHIWAHDPIGLAYLRSEQSADGRSGLCQHNHLSVVADVRLDNREELIRLLAAKGYQQDKDAPDAAIVLTAFECWGAKCCVHLQGAYSIACWNQADSSLILLRDRLGERPLYWHSTPQALFFASEPAQLLDVGSAGTALSQERILAYLLKLPFDPAWSFFRSIQRLPEGYYLKCQDRRTSLERYWSTESLAGQGLNRQQVTRALSDVLGQAVVNRLARSKETGVLLSGGLDSSSVAAKAAAALDGQGRRLFAFTWQSNTGDAIDERRRSAALVSARPNIDEFPILADELFPLSRYPEAFTDPNSPDTNAYPDLLLTTLETARQNGVGVLMNGIGGDLMVGGVLPEMALLRQGQFAALARRLKASPRLSLSRLVRQAQSIRRTELPGWITPDARRLVHKAGMDRPTLLLKALESPASLRAYVITQPASAMNLERFDRLSARTGVRLTAPWYDLGIAALMLSLEDGGVDMDAPGKSLLRRTLAEELPDSLRSTSVPKNRATTLPVQGLVRQGKVLIDRWLGSSALGQMGLIDPTRIIAAYQEATRSERVMPGIWEIITLEIWIQLHYN